MTLVDSNGSSVIDSCEYREGSTVEILQLELPVSRSAAVKTDPDKGLNLCPTTPAPLASWPSYQLAMPLVFQLRRCFRSSRMPRLFAISRAALSGSQRSGNGARPARDTSAAGARQSRSKKARDAFHRPYPRGGGPMFQRVRASRGGSDWDSKRRDAETKGCTLRFELS